MRFKDKTVFITGGASGMGLATAKLLLNEGANVAVMDLNDAASVLGGHGDSVLALKGDAFSASDLRRSLGEVSKRFGPLHMAVNAAGVTGRLAPIVEQDDSAIDIPLAINVKGVFLAMKLEATIMRETGGGSIVNFASVYSQASHANMVLYGATKHAVLGLTEGAAVEFAALGIRVNAVSPGPILTPFNGDVTPEIEQAVVAGIPQRRIGRATEVSGAVAWLLSDEASYVTGANLVIDGGQSARLAG